MSGKVTQQNVFRKENTVNKEDQLIEAALLALGWIVGKGGITEPPALALALALQKQGIESSYLTHIISTYKANAARTG